MKTKAFLLTALVGIALTLTASADDKAGHDHDKQHAHEKKEGGPNGGRILTKIEPHVEFFVTADRKVRLTFLGEDGKAIAPAAQVVTVTAGDRAAPARLTFARSGDVLVSDVALPAGNDFPAVVQIKATPDAKAVVEKFNVNLSTCGECSLAEYACTCAH